VVSYSLILSNVSEDIMPKSKKMTKREGYMTTLRWVVLLFAGIIIGGATVALERRFNLERSTLMNAIVAGSVLIILISFAGFMSRLRE